MEAAGLSTITLTGIPELTASEGVPRLAAVARPLGYLLGQPGDAEGQQAVLTAVLEALAAMDTPGEEKHLRFGWPEDASVLKNEPPETPPIVQYLKRHPWHLRNFYAREAPERFLVDGRG
jgi:hypothetical protein